CAIDEVEVDAVVEEQLGDHEVEAGVDLGAKVRDVAVEIAALDVPLGAAGAAEADLLAVALADEADQVGGVAEAAGGALEALLPGRGVATQGHDVVDARVDELIDDAADLGLGGADAGEVGHGRQVRLALDPADDLEGLAARRAAGAVRHRDE